MPCAVTVALHHRDAICNIVIRCLFLKSPDYWDRLPEGSVETIAPIDTDTHSCLLEDPSQQAFLSGSPSLAAALFIGWCNVVAERGKLSQHAQRPVSDDDAARLRERLLVCRPIEGLRGGHRHPSCEEAAKRRTRKGHRGVPAHGQCSFAHEAFTAQDGRKGR